MAREPAVRLSRGARPSRVHLKADILFEDKPIHNVIPRWRGAEKPDEWIVIGNHRDAWVHGAVDPNSGTAALLECARALGKLKEQGFKPKRTIVFASWDAEEYGLVGSTEWCEDLREELEKKCVCYINVDAGVSGREFRASAAPRSRASRATWRPPWRIPKKGGASSTCGSSAPSPRPRIPLSVLFVGNDGEDPKVGDLGSGSDYTAFQHHLGIPSLDIQFEGPYGVYHSVLDDFFWMERFGDPSFSSHRALARYLGVALLRMSSADLLPIRPEAQANAIIGHLGDLMKQYPEVFAANSEKTKAADELRSAAARLGELPRIWRPRGARARGRR